jgi:hypothetical protein
MGQREADVMDVVEALKGLTIENGPALNALKENVRKVPSHNLKGVEIDDDLLSTALNRLTQRQNQVAQAVQNQGFRDPTVWNQAM